MVLQDLGIVLDRDLSRSTLFLILEIVVGFHYFCQFKCDVVLCSGGAAIHGHRRPHGWRRDWQHLYDHPLRSGVLRIESQKARIVIRDPTQNLQGLFSGDLLIFSSTYGSQLIVLTLSLNLVSEMCIDFHASVSYAGEGLSRVGAGPAGLPHAGTMNSRQTTLGVLDFR